MKKFTFLLFFLFVMQVWSQTPDWYNIQWLTDGTNGSNTLLIVNAWTTVTGYAQVYEPGVTNATGQGSDVECWIGGMNQNTDPSTWNSNSWNVAVYNGDVGNNDEYKLVKVMDFVGTAYVAARWRLNGGPYVYGGYNGPWDGTTNNSIQLIVNPVVPNDDCSGAIALTVNSNSICTSVTSGTTNQATESHEAISPCADSNDEDVWFSFVAANNSHAITLSNITGTSTDMYFQVLSGSCSGLTSILCSDPETNSVNNLIIGNTYFVRVYNATGGYTPNNFDICVSTPSNLGMENQNQIDGFKMYPNPSENILTLKADATIEEINIYNLYGQVVKKMSNNSNEMQLNLSELHSGVYILNVKSDIQTGNYNLFKK